MWGVGFVQIRLQLQAESCNQAIEGMNRETQPCVIVEIGFDKALRRTEIIATESSNDSSTFHSQCRLKGIDIAVVGGEKERNR